MSVRRSQINTVQTTHQLSSDDNSTHALGYEQGEYLYKKGTLEKIQYTINNDDDNDELMQHFLLQNIENIAYDET